jgi:hypothetical protein
MLNYPLPYARFLAYSGMLIPSKNTPATKALNVDTLILIFFPWTWGDMGSNMKL